MSTTVRSAVLTLAVLAVVLMALRFYVPIQIHGEGAFSPNGVFSATPSEPGLARPLGTYVHADEDRGRLISDAFFAPPVLGFALSGGTSRPGEHVYLQDIKSGDTISIVPSVEPGESWVHLVRVLPVGWWGHRTIFVADDSGGGYRAWLGVADLHVAAPAEALALLGPWALIIVLAGLSVIVVLPFASAAIGITSRLDHAWASGVSVYSITLLLLGCSAEAVFFLTRANASIGQYALGGLLIGGLAYTTYVLSRPALRRRLLEKSVWLPWAVTLAISLIYGIVLAQTVHPGDMLIQTATAAWWPFPPDNIIPELLARQVHDGLGPRPFLGDWLTSDRPPLQAGLDLFSMWLLPSHALDDVRYEALGLWLQCWSFGALTVLALACGFCQSRALFAVGCCSTTGFFFINALYTWPKLLTVAFGATAIALILDEQFRERRMIASFAIAGGLLGLGFLSHGGIIFTIPALVVAALVRFRAVAVRPLLVGLAAALILFAPWTIYQKTVDPPGDRLIKWQIGGQVAPDLSRSSLRVVVDAYTSQTLGAIAAMKLNNLESLFVLRAPWRSSEFFSVFWSVGFFWIPIVALALRKRAPPPEAITKALVLIGFGSLLVWCLIMWTGTIIHQGSYLTMALIMLSGALVAGRSFVTGTILAVALVLDFSLTWLVHVIPSRALVVDVAGCCIVGLACRYWSVRHEATAIEQR